MEIDKEALKTKLIRNKAEGFEFQKRRHPQWKENYELYRDTVIINRLTQRQSVNIPLAKETCRTILAGINEQRDTIFEELGNDKDKEIFLNEYWKEFYRFNKLKLKDIVDKKQVLWYGRSWQKLMIADGKPYSEVEDPQDILIYRYVDPTDTDSAQYIIHQHIFKDLDEVKNNENYDKEAIARIESGMATDEGAKLSSENAESLQHKNERLRDLGLADVDNPTLGQTIVELNEHYVKLWDEEKKKPIIHVATTCLGELLMVKPLSEILGKTEDNYWDDHYPFVSWADDVERIDFYSDGWMDVVRTPNKILNAWFSQLVENRTLRNFGMNYFDSTMEGFVPQTFDPIPGGWYPIPVPEGKTLKDVFQKVDVPDLSESLDEMQFLIGLVESATAATKVEKGQSEKGDVTLGEVKLITAKAQKRIGDISIFYTEAQEEYAMKWYKLIEAGADQLEAVKVFKKSYKGNWYSETITPDKWKSKLGYRCRIVSKADQDQEAIEGIQKLTAAQQYFQSNAPFKKLFDKKMLDFIGATPEEIKEITDYEEQQMQPQDPMGGMPGMPGQPAPQLDMSQLTPPQNVPMGIA